MNWRNAFWLLFVLLTDQFHLAKKNMLRQPYKAEKVTQIELHPAEAKLIEYLRELKWGSVEITLQDGVPVLIKQAVKSIKLM